MTVILRLIRHFLASYWQVKRQFPPSSLAVIKSAIQQAEGRHSGEIQFAIEAALSPAQLVRGMTAQERALEVFSLLRVWDTEHNNGVLIYVLLGDRAVEIIADRGIHTRTGGSSVWQRIIVTMQEAFAEGRFEAGAMNGIAGVAEVLGKHFPLRSGNVDELPDDVALL